MSVSVLRCHEAEEALGAYALDALEPEEAAAVAAHLAVCPRCQALAVRATATADALAALVPPVSPPPALRDRLMASIAAESSPPAIAPVTPLRPRRRVSAAMLALAASVALLLVAAAVLALQLGQARDDRDSARETAQMISSYVSAGGHMVPLATQNASIYAEYSARGTLLMAPGKQPLVVVSGCPKSSEHLTYKVWVARGGERTPAGELWVDEDGSGMLMLSPAQPLGEFDTVGVTALMPENRREDVLVGALPAGTVS